MTDTNPPSRPFAPPDHIGVMIASALMMVFGWGGLYLLVTTRHPYVGERWQFFVLLFIAVSATALPFVRFLNRRFNRAGRPLPNGTVLVRQSAWIGLFAVTCAWLQIPRVLSAPIAFFLALALVIIEVFLRSREIANERFN